MRGTDGQSNMSRRKKHSRRPGFSGKSMHGLQLYDAHTERPDNFPASDRRSQSHGEGTQRDHPTGNFRRGNLPRRYERQRDNPHGLLRIVCAVTKGHKAGGDQLEPTEQPGGDASGHFEERPRDKHHQRESHEETEQWREHHGFQYRA